MFSQAILAVPVFYSKFLLQIIKMTQMGKIATISRKLHMLRSHHCCKVRERGREYKQLKPPDLAVSAAKLGG